MILLTDGLVETHAPDGTTFGTGRVLDLIRAHQHRTSCKIVQTLYHKVLKFADKNLRDDITAIVAKVL